MLKTIPSLVREIRQNLRCVTAAQATVEIGTNGGVLIDVREPGEVAQKAAPNSINFPRGVLEMNMLQHHPHPDVNIYIHCATGARATLAAEQLQRLGYRRVAVVTCDLDSVCAQAAISPTGEGT